MRDAFALVVGIDQYELDGIPTLPHCVDDALAALTWLRTIGVPDDRVLLHLSPSEGRTIDTSGLVVRGCGHRDIIRSINLLAAASADQLFVFMSGHGLFVLSKGSVFLPSDYGVDGLKPNFWLEEYLRYFLSWHFERQYVVYNACKEPIATIGQVSPVTPEGPPLPPENYKVAPDNALTVCHAAAPDEKAWVGNKEGTLISYLLRELAPARLGGMEPGDTMQSAVIYDWETGAREIDLKVVFDLAVGPAFRFRAQAAGNLQTPFCHRLGAAERIGCSPIIALPHDTYLPVVITVDPPEAMQAIAQIALRSLEPARELLLPRIDKRIELPMRCLGPAGAMVHTTFRADPASSWRRRRSPPLAAIIGDGIEIILELESTAPPPFDPDEPPDASSTPPPPTGPAIYGIQSDAFNIRASSPTGVGRFLPEGAYEAVLSGPFAPVEPPTGVLLERYDIGLDIRFDPNIPGADGAARGLASSWLHAFRSTYLGEEFEFLLSPIGDDFDRPTTNFRFILPPGGARRLGGYFAAAPIVSLEPLGFPEGARRMSLDQIERHPTEYLEPGYYRVSVDLPWGGWTHGVGVGLSDEVAECRLPERIGVEPLRHLASFGGTSERSWIRRSKVTAATSFSVIVSTGDRRFAIPGAGIDLLLQHDVGGIRIEPNSQTDVPEWDIAFSTGRASALETSRIRELLSDGTTGGFQTSGERDLMLLACAYAAFGRNEAYLTLEVLAEMRGIYRDSVDATLLGHAIGLDEEAWFVRCCAESSFVPLLRWGVPVMQSILDRHGCKVPDWTRHLSFNTAWTTLDEEGIECLLQADERAERTRTWELVELDAILQEPDLLPK